MKDGSAPHSLVDQMLQSVARIRWIHGMSPEGSRADMWPNIHDV
ncbi:MAG: hypothetical protein WBQ03_04715 [Candidatus Sulfotelmatobacter sp.]